MLAVVPEVRETLEPVATVADRTSPILPAFAALLVVVPIMPFVCDGVIAPVADTVVNAPVDGIFTPTVAPSIDVMLIELLHAGAVPTPPEVKRLPVATSANLAGVAGVAVLLA